MGDNSGADNESLSSTRRAGVRDDDYAEARTGSLKAYYHADGQLLWHCLTGGRKSFINMPGLHENCPCRSKILRCLNFFVAHKSGNELELACRNASDTPER